MERLAELARKLNREHRAKQAAALRAMRRVDRAMAKFALKRWKDYDAISRAATDVFIYGSGTIKVEHVPHVFRQAPPAPHSVDRTDASGLSTDA